MVRQEKVRVALGAHLSVSILLNHTAEHVVFKQQAIV
jgi:hypothetical protein